MANITKYSKELIDSIMKDLAHGMSIKASLKNHDLSWECFRKWLIDEKKYPSLRGKYSQAKQDGIEYSLSDAQSLINEAVQDSKHKEQRNYHLKSMERMINCRFLAIKIHL